MTPCFFSAQQVVESPRRPQRCETSLCFSDGRRKVDYVLVFHPRQRSSLRSPATVSASHEMLAIVSNGSFPPVGSDVEAARGGGTRPGEAASAGEAFVEVRGNEPAEPAFYEMRMIREEFEANLLEAGLEMERDSEVSASACVRLRPPAEAAPHSLLRCLLSWRSGRDRTPDHVRPTSCRLLF